jgi:hypothetical protein
MGVESNPARGSMASILERRSPNSEGWCRELWRAWPFPKASDASRCKQCPWELQLVERLRCHLPLSPAHLPFSGPDPDLGP